MKSTDEQIGALQAEVDGLRQALAELKAAAVEEMRKCSEAVAGTAITPAFYQHQLMCGLLASRKDVILSEEANTYWWQVSAIYKAGVERGIYPKEQP